MPSKLHRQKIVRSARKLVIKIGTNVLADERGRLNTRRVLSLCRQICELIAAGREVVVVSSGAIGAGVGVLGLPGRPRDLPMLQAAAAVGQNKLMQVFETGFRRFGLHAAQILVTRSDFENRRRYVNINNTLRMLHHLRAVPIINENDTVAVDEIRFGENDLLAALAANLVRADLLAILTSVEGFMDDGGDIIDFVEQVNGDIFNLVDTRKTTLGVGGMETKLQAIYLATQAGIDVVLANGRRSGILKRLILSGEQVGTVFAAQSSRLDGRRRWIALAVRPAGKLVIDAGATRALVTGGKSLLPSGVVSIVGKFDRGAIVAVVDDSGRELARGQVTYSSAEIAKIKSRRTTEIAAVLGFKLADEVIHRNNLIVTAG